VTFDGDGLPGWFADAACLGHPEPELWFPEGQGSSPKPAQAVCAGCPVREPCGAYADAEGFTCGVWGGVSRSKVSVGRAA
jgi:hypothetical protein